jgi:hydrogenase-4 component D
MMEMLALATILVPFAGALIVLLSPKEAAKWIGQLFSALASLCVLGTWIAFWKSAQPSVTFDLLSVGQTQLFGLTIDPVSVLIGFAVVFLGFLVCVYSMTYLSEGNREHPHEGRPRYYAFLLIFIGAMAGLVFSSTVIGQLLFFEITGACSWGLIGYYEKAQGSAGGDEGVDHYPHWFRRPVFRCGLSIYLYRFVCTDRHPIAWRQCKNCCHHGNPVRRLG